MSDDRELKPGEVTTTATAKKFQPELVEVRHAELDVTQVVRRSRLPQMDPAWEVVEPEQLKGDALEQALEDAGLPKTGSADEKRARLAEHQAETLS